MNGLDCSNGDNCCNAKYKVEFVYPTNIHTINNIGDLLMNNDPYRQNDAPVAPVEIPIILHFFLQLA